MEGDVEATSKKWRNLDQCVRDSMILHHDTLRLANPGLPHADAERYDEFAIGWNEIFDQGFPPISAGGGGYGGGFTTGASSSSAAAPPFQGASTSSPRRLSSDGAGRAGTRVRNTASSGGGSGGGGDSAFWASEVLTSKKPPPYLRVAGGQRSAIDKGMKEKLMDCPMTELRKPSEVMEIQLVQLRTHVASTHHKKIREARQDRRLQRRCRVRDGEDLDNLQERYTNSELLRPLFLDPVEHAHTARTPGVHGQMTKDFFVKLGRHHVSPRSSAAAADAGTAAGDPVTARAPSAGAAAANSATAALPEEPHTAR